MKPFHHSFSFAHLPRPGSVTKGLCGLLVGISLLSAISQRKGGLGSQDLMFQADAVLHGEIWRLATYAFVKTTPFGLLISGLILWLFGQWYENRWGSRDYLGFFFASTLGAAILAIPLSYLINFIMPFKDLGLAEGPDAAIDAMMVALALHAPNSRVLLGFLLPIPAKSIVFILLGIDVVSGILVGASTLSITLGGIIMGYLLVTGAWRPGHIISRIRLWKLRRRRDSLYVVRPHFQRMGNAWATHGQRMGNAWVCLRRGPEDKDGAQHSIDALYVWPVFLPIFSTLIFSEEALVEAAEK